MTTTSLSLKLIFPWPDSRLNPNSSRRHWKSKMRPTHKAREESAAIALGEKQAMIQYGYPEPGFPWDKAVMHIIWYPPTGRRRDYGNLLSALKPTIDGIVDAGVLVDDSSRHLAFGNMVCAQPDRVKPRVEIVLERAG